jgi:poly(3-hydroxybutyrate) depolymerase
MGWVYRLSHPAAADSSCRRRKQPFVTAITVKVATGCNDRASGFSGGILSAERSKGDPNAEIQSMTFLQMTRGNAGRNLKSAILAAFFASIIPFASLHAAEIKNEQLTVGGSERSYIISTPRVRGPQPTVLVLHGSLANGPMAMLGMGFQKLVDREELVAVYPSAVAGEWNDGHEMAASWSGAPPDDVAFLRTLVEHLVRTGVADPARVYVTGFSSGGMMAFRLMCEAPESVAAIAPIAATIPADLLPGCKPQRATPTLMINGTADQFVPLIGCRIWTPTTGRTSSSRAGQIAPRPLRSSCIGWRAAVTVFPVGRVCPLLTFCSEHSITTLTRQRRYGAFSRTRSDPCRRIEHVPAFRW